MKIWVCDVCKKELNYEKNAFQIPEKGKYPNLQIKPMRDGVDLCWNCFIERMGIFLTDREDKG